MTETEIKKIVHNYYWKDDINCATTTLKTLSEVFPTKIASQVVDSAVGMHGAGKYGAQCGLVEGSLLFVGIYGRSLNWEDKEIVDMCSALARAFENDFSSLLCNQLRPSGFNDTDPEHLCEEITVKAINWGIDFIYRQNVSRNNP